MHQTQLNHNPSRLSTADIELLEINIKLWQELSDEAFEQHFRRRYFGDEIISRQQAVARLMEQKGSVSSEGGARGGGDLLAWTQTWDPVPAALQDQQRPSTIADGQACETELRLTLLKTPVLAWRSFLASLLGHVLITWVILSVRLPQRRLALIDFETDRITYYKISQLFPNIAPEPSRQEPPSEHPTRGAGKPSVVREEVRIRPEARQTTETVVERNDLPQVPSLPKLNLPNILMQETRLNPGRAPLVLSSEVAGALALQDPSLQTLNELPQNPTGSLVSRQPVPLRPQLALPVEPGNSPALSLDQLSASRSLVEKRPAGLPYAAPPVEEPAASFQIAQGVLAQQAPQALASRQPLVPRPSLAVPVEAAGGVAVPISQIAAPSSVVEQKGSRLPYAAPPVEEPVSGIQVQREAGTPGLLVYSTSPATPGPEVAVPRLSTTGRLVSTAAAGNLPPGGKELAQAEVVMPSISIKNRGVPAVPGPSVPVVQAPIPKPPREPQLTQKEQKPSLLDLLPSRLPPKKLSVADLRPVEAASPLQEYEQRGGPVYTAAINAPNFSSKRGSWIFRFAELLPAVPIPAEPQSSGGQAGSVVPESNGQPESHLPLTPPSATVKVDPKYLPEVVRDRVEGAVVLFAILRKDGRIDSESIRVVRKVDPRLDSAARDALLAWKFKPSLKNGTAVDIQMEVSIPFYFRPEAF